MKKPVNPNPSKVIIIPQTPQNNNREEVAPQGDAPVAVPTPAQNPVQQQAEAEVETVDEEVE